MYGLLYTIWLSIVFSLTLNASVGRYTHVGIGMNNISMLMCDLYFLHCAHMIILLLLLLIYN